MSEFAYGVDLGWVSQLEAEGFHWIDADGNEEDPVSGAKERGADSVRLRIYVNPPESAYWQKREDERVMLGYGDMKRVTEMAKRCAEDGMRIMLDFHYSDHFADPSFQDIPEEWSGHSAAQLAEDVYAHTKEVLSYMKERGVSPEWVQVGNEINHGILLPAGSAADHPSDLAHMLNRGYDAVKEVFPECLVITHLAELTDEEGCLKFFDQFFTNGGKTDVIGLSNYPYWYGRENYKRSAEGYFRLYSERYGKPVMVTEIGAEDNLPDETYDLILENIKALKSLPDGKGLGVFYWEPEVNHAMLPDGYLLGASELVSPKTLRYTRALTAFRDGR